MDKKVYVSILGASTVDGECDDTQIVTEGEYAERNGKYLLRYKEQIVDDYAQCSTIIKFDTDSVVMTRSGNVNTQMIFEKGKRHLSHYETPMGSFTIGVLTDDLIVDVGEKGGRVEIEYVLDINNTSCIRNKLKLDIRGASI